MCIKVGDKVTVTPVRLGAVWAARDCTEGKTYEVIYTGKGHGQAGGESDEDVQFIDDVGDKVVVHQCDVTLVN